VAELELFYQFKMHIIYPRHGGGDNIANNVIVILSISDLLRSKFHLEPFLRLDRDMKSKTIPQNFVFKVRYSVCIPGLILHKV